VGTLSILRIERLNYLFGGVLVILAALFATQDQALGVAVGVALTCLNFFFLRKLVFKWTAAVKAGDERGSARIYLILPKMIGLMAAVVLIMLFLPIHPVGFVIGYSIFIASIVVGAVLDLLMTPSPEPGAPTGAPNPTSRTHG
jgi:ATP synthase I chain